ncbi:MAG: hypothetical protein JW838_06935 [Spirochaetes bacterium]|nr:hypothetical protein [Spirochaetota bacterium]
MKIRDKVILAFTILVIVGMVPEPGAFGQGGEETEKGEPLLGDIAAEIDAYRSKTVTLALKLKRVDVVFEKIVFYDGKNHDIAFDISSRETRKRIAGDMRTLHPGVVYRVTFIVRDRGSLGEVIGDIVGFRPAFLDAVPGGG